jgi:environmental stress-induced protein Ves
MSSALSAAGPVLLRARDRVEVPWRNGGGTTTVVATSGDYEAAGGARGAGGGVGGVEPDWRVSIATIAEAGSFSVFRGVDRVLVPLTPAGLTLDVGGSIRHLAQHEAIEFAGEESVAAVDVDAPGDDLNLMTRRGVVTGSLTMHSLAEAAEFSTGIAETRMLVVLAGAIAWGDQRLGPRDALLLPPSTRLTVNGRADLAVISVRQEAVPKAYSAVRPPSMTSSVPVVYDDSPDARNRTTV